MAPSSSEQPAPEQQPTDPIEQLERLAKLHADGMLTDEEFASKKTEIVRRI